MSSWGLPALPAWWVDAGGPSFVGRDHEVGVLAQMWTAAGEGVRQTVFLGGEPGAGKTRLVSQAMAALERQGAPVLLGHCLADSPVAYEPFRDPIAALVTAIGGLAGVEDGDRIRRRLRALLGQAPLSQKQDDRMVWEYHETVVEALRLLTRQQPAAMVLEDMHWATASTLRLLAHVVQRGKDLRLLLVVTHRPSPPDRSEPLAATVAGLYGDAGVHRIDLDGLDATAVRQFVRSEADLTPESAERLAPRLRSQTGGNPFLLGEICRDLRVGGTVVGEVQPRVPGPVRDTFAARLARLEPGSRELVELAAVLGERVPASRLLAASPYDPEHTRLGAERAVGAGLLGVADNGSDYRFAHALARQAVLESIQPLRRVEHHARAARALEGAWPRGLPEIRQLAHHYSQCTDDASRSRARGYLLEAGERSSRALAFHEAADAFLRAADLFEHSEERHRAQLRAVPCLVGAGRFVSAMEVSLRITEEADDPADRLIAATEHERAGWRLGHPSSVPVLAAALQQYPGDPTDEAYVRALASLGRALSSVGETEDGAEVSRTALDRARTTGDERLLAHALDCRLWTLLQPEEEAAARVHADELTALARRLGDHNLLGSTSVFRCTVAYMTGDREALLSGAADLRWASERSGYAYLRLASTAVDAGLHFLDGELDTAEAALSEITQQGDDREGDDAQGMAGVHMFLVRREAGRLDEVRPLITGTENPQDHWAPGLLGLYAELGMTAPAAGLLRDLLDHPEDQNRRSATWPAVLTFMTEAALGLGDLESLRRLRPLLEPYQGLNLCCGLFGVSLGSADRLVARIDAELGHGEPLALFDAAEDLDSRTGSRVHLATTLADRARYLAGSADAADRAQAGAVAARARVLAVAAGQRRVLDRLAEIAPLPAPGRDGSPRGGGSADADAGAESGLTPRELEVLELLVRGASNQEISEKLVISPHTAAHHVRNILMKTGAANRTRAAMTAVAKGWVTTD